MRLRMFFMILVLALVAGCFPVLAEYGGVRGGTRSSLVFSPLAPRPAAVLALPTKPSPKPTSRPTLKPSPKPTTPPSPRPTILPTPRPSMLPTPIPRASPTPMPSAVPTRKPTPAPSSPSMPPVPSPRPTPLPTIPSDSWGGNSASTASYTWLAGLRGPAYSELGSSVAVLGNTLALGATEYNLTDGSIFVFKITGSAFSKAQMLKLPQQYQQENSNFVQGSSLGGGGLSLGNFFLAAAAPAFNNTNGAILVYTRQSATSQAFAFSQIVGGAGPTFSQLGTSLASFDSSTSTLSAAVTLVAGAPYYNSSMGSVMVYFASSSSGKFVQQQMLTPTSLQLVNSSAFLGNCPGGCFFGTSVALDNTGLLLAVGAPNFGGYFHGSVFIFSRTQTTSSNSMFKLRQQLQLSPFNSPGVLNYNAFFDSLGSSLCFSSNGYLAVGASATTNYAGGVYLFALKMTGSYSNLQFLAVNVSSGTMGNAVSMSTTGTSTFLAVSSTGLNNNDGGVYLYTASSGSIATSTPTALFTSIGALYGTPADVSYFGNSLVALSNNMLLVTAYQASASYNGAMYLFGPSATTKKPSSFSTAAPTNMMSKIPITPRPTTPRPSATPTLIPSPEPTPTPNPTNVPTPLSKNATFSPTNAPVFSAKPLALPSPVPSTAPGMTSRPPTISPTTPTFIPTTSKSPSPKPSPFVITTFAPSLAPTPSPSRLPTVKTTASPSPKATSNPSCAPSFRPTPLPTAVPSSSKPTPTPLPTMRPSTAPTKTITDAPTTSPPSLSPTRAPTKLPSPAPSPAPTKLPSPGPTVSPSPSPSSAPTPQPSPKPSSQSTPGPTQFPTLRPSPRPSTRPTLAPTPFPTFGPTLVPTSTVQKQSLNDNKGASSALNTGGIIGILGAIVLVVLALMYLVHRRSSSAKAATPPLTSSPSPPPTPAPTMPASAPAETVVSPLFNPQQPLPQQQEQQPQRGSYSSYAQKRDERRSLFASNGAAGGQGSTAADFTSYPDERPVMVEQNPSFGQMRRPSSSISTNANGNFPSISSPESISNRRLAARPPSFLARKGGAADLQNSL